MNEANIVAGKVVSYPKLDPCEPLPCVNNYLCGIVDVGVVLVLHRGGLVGAGKHLGRLRTEFKRVMGARSALLCPTHKEHYKLLRDQNHDPLKERQ